MIDDKRLSELDVLKIISGDELNTNSFSFASLSEVILEMGYEIRAYQIGRNALNKLINLPMIVKIENDPRYPHFVVIINYYGDYIKILDPSHGEYISSKKDFLVYGIIMELVVIYWWLRQRVELIIN